MESRVLVATDDQLILVFQKTGDKECFAELFSRHRRRVFLACRGFFRDEQMAEDATQETFLRVYRNSQGFQGGDLSNWLTRVAKNACIDLWRKNRVEPISAAEGLVEGSISPIPDLSAMRFAVDTVLNEMKALSPEQQQCLEMKIEGYSYEETAARTGLHVDSVKSHLQNGRRMLWRRLEGKLF